MGFVEITLLLGAVATSHSSYSPNPANGFTLKVYNNSGWAGIPSATRVVSSLDYSEPVTSSTTPFTLEFTGTLSYPTGQRCFENDAGCFTFNCSFSGATYAFLWFDDHLVCQTGAYTPHANTFDGSEGNPLRVLRKRAVAVRLRVFFSPLGHNQGSQEVALRNVIDSNLLTIGKNTNVSNISIQSLQSTPGMEQKLRSVLACNGTWVPNTDSLGSDYKEVGRITQEACCALCVADSKCSGIVWNSPNGPYHDRGCNMKYSLNNQKARSGQMLCRIRPDRSPPSPAPPPLPTSVDISVKWASGFPAGPFQAIPSKLVLPTLVPEEETRVELQSNLTDGWGTWANSVLDIVLMPEATRLTVGLCQLSTGKCITSTRPSDTDTMRVAEHAYDKSYVRMFLTFGGINVSVEFSSGTGTQSSDLQVLLTPVDGCTVVNCSDFAAVFLSSYAWSRAGDVAMSNTSLTFSPFGLRETTLFFTSPNDATIKHNGGRTPSIAFVLGDGAGVSTSRADTVASIKSHMQSAQAAVLAKLKKYGDLAEVARAVQAAVMWCLLYIPSELGPFAPVSRSWAFLTPTQVAPGSEWIYVIFDWDNIFASYLFALDAPQWAYSNLVQVIRSKTAQGFIANFASAGQKSLDRTEPMIGAKVLLELYRKYGDKWIVELLLDDIIDWHDWFSTYRLLPPLNLVCLGSNSVPGDTYWSPNTLPSSRLESGLDNSPMWDDTTFNTTSHQMQLYELSQSSFYVTEAEHLIELATIIGRPDAVAGLAAKADAMRQRIAQNMWDDTNSVFTNKYPNGDFYRRISPTSFYPLLANASTDDQADRMMVHWLTNKTRFCINPNYETENLPECYWGLPSISMDDPAFPPLGYWRGFTWGPMAQIVYWSLQTYDHVPSVRAARKALCGQMTAMFLDQWNRHAHVCENFNPHQNSSVVVGGKTWPDDCTGTKFYHWGALAGMISLIENGYW